MTNREAKLRKEGYSYRGIYSRSREEMKERAIQERAKGFYAVVVTIPDSPYSRGTIGVGYSVYTKPTAKKLTEIEAEKKAAEQKVLDDMKAISFFLLDSSKEELADLLIKELGEGLLSWAKAKGIIQ